MVGAGRPRDLDRVVDVTPTACAEPPSAAERRQSVGMSGTDGTPDFSLGSVHAVTRQGALFIASFSGSQLVSYAWGAASVIFAVGAQKLVPNAEAARERIFQHSLPLEDARAFAAYGQNSAVGKILEIHQEQPGRIHVVLIRQSVGF